MAKKQGSELEQLLKKINDKLGWVIFWLIGIVILLFSIVSILGN